MKGKQVRIPKGKRNQSNGTRQMLKFVIQENFPEEKKLETTY